MRKAISVAVVAMAMGAAAACGSKQVVDEGPLPADIKPAGIVLLPVALGVPDSNALEVVARSLDVSRLVLQLSDLPLLGPLDFDINKSLDEVRNASYDTDLTAKEEAVGTEWHNWLAMHVLITENRATNVRDIVDVKAQAAGKKGVYRQHGIEATVRVEIGLYDVKRGNRIAWATSEVMDDPTQFAPGGDPRPGITAAVQKTMARLFEMGGPALFGPVGRRTRGEGLADALPAMLQWRAPELPSYLDTVKGQADEVREAKIFSLWDRFVPNLSAKEIFAANKAKGLLVRSKLPPLEAGDVITAIDGKKVQAAYQFDRLVRICSPSTSGCKVELLRNNEPTTLMLRWPALPPPKAP